MSFVEAVRPWLARAGVSRAVFYGVLWKVTYGLFSLGVVLLILWRFPREIQGYYYTFSNLVALQVFAEMGLGIVITQFASHYWAKLGLDDRGRIEGDPDSLSRLISIGRLSLRWYGIAGVLAVGVIGLSGYVFFSSSSKDGVEWQLPWLTLCVLTGLKMWLIPVGSLLEGCNQVGSLYFWRFLNSLAAGAVTMIAILLNARLWALSVGVGAEVVTGAVYLGTRHLQFISSFLQSKEGPTVAWKSDVFPLQIRIALTWMAGYFVTSFFTPVLFRFQGPAVAGQWGVTWSIFSMVTNISLMWIITKAPQFGMWVAQREFEVLDREFWRQTRISFALAILGVGTLWSGIWLVHQWGLPMASRVLSPLPAGLIGLSVILLNVPSAQAVYLRAHKQEPFLVSAIVQSLLVVAVNLALAKRYGAVGMAAGYLTIAVVLVLPWTTFLWQRCRSEWHAPLNAGVDAPAVKQAP